MFVLDTCTVSDFLKHIDPSLNKKVLAHTPQQFFISALTVDEIEYGLSRNLEKAKKYRPLVSAFLKEIGPEHILPVDARVAEAAGKTRAMLAQKGLVVEQYDLLIGVTALVHQMTVVTANVKHFKIIPGVIVENWRQALH
jgi:tRNA(fMet)-specific endonuclease VapC